jgi:hypothetical protein
MFVWIKISMSNNLNITEKQYKKIAIQVATSGFSYCVFDTLDNTIKSVNEVDFSDYPKEKTIEEKIDIVFNDHKKLSKKYDEVVVIHDNNYNTFVPKALFDENFMGSYLQYNSKVFENDFFTYDALSNYEINNVYIPYVNINNSLLDRFKSFDYKNSNSILVSKLLDLSKNIEEKQVFVHVGTTKFELVVVQNQQLIFFNSFDYKTPEDFIYYLLFTAEQLDLNPENFKLYLLGKITDESALYKIAYAYVRNISLLDVSSIKRNNKFSNIVNLQHFILFQS